PPAGGPGAGSGGPGGRDRSANFGPPAPPRRLRNAKKGNQQEHKPRGPIKEKTGGRIYAVDDLDEGETPELDDIATALPDEGIAAALPDDEGDDQD
ncbi:MAG: hypothetical protein HOP14_00020, partial [Acidobacteria bacterium]|nr:hypothetical protein [Acidobacteriota bacterium]